MSAVAAAPSTAELGAPPIRKRRRRITFYILPVFTIGVIVYLAMPVLLMVVYSFNNLAGERQIPRFTCCTLNWWRNMTEITELNASLRLSVLIAPVSAAVATLLGTLIGLVLGRYSFRGRAGTNFIIFLAIAIPEIVLGSSLLTMFTQLNVTKPLGIEIPPGWRTIGISHIGFSVAFVAVTVRARVSGLDRSLENAAQDLFATPFVAFFRVTLPLIFPGIIAGFLLSFVLSLDDFVITTFVNGSENTFPTWVFGTGKLGMPPQVNVWGTILFAVGLFVAGLNLLGAARAQRRNRAS